MIIILRPDEMSSTHFFYIYLLKRKYYPVTISPVKAYYAEERDDLKLLATVPSQTSASRLKKSLAVMGIKSNIVQTPSALTKEGCGYSLRFDDKYRVDVAQAARELRVTVRAYFVESGGEYIRQ